MVFLRTFFRTEPLDRRLSNRGVAGRFSDDIYMLVEAHSKGGTRLTAEAAGLFLDYSKNRVTDQTLKLLIRSARAARIPSPAEKFTRTSGSASQYSQEVPESKIARHENDAAVAAHIIEFVRIRIPRSIQF